MTVGARIGAGFVMLVFPGVVGVVGVVAVVCSIRFSDAGDVVVVRSTVIVLGSGSAVVVSTTAGSKGTAGEVEVCGAAFGAIGRAIAGAEGASSGVTRLADTNVGGAGAASPTVLVLLTRDAIAWK